MDHVNILSDKVQACFKSVAEDLRFNAVFDKETGHADGDAYFQTADSYYDNRCVSTAMLGLFLLHCVSLCDRLLLLQEKAREHAVAVGSW